MPLRRLAPTGHHNSLPSLLPLPPLSGLRRSDRLFKMPRLSSSSSVGRESAPCSNRMLNRMQSTTGRANWTIWASE